MAGLCMKLTALCILLSVSEVFGFKYDINEIYPLTTRWSFTEQYMYGSKQSPVPFQNEHSTISVDLDVYVNTFNNEDSMNVSVLFYHEGEDFISLPDVDICYGEKPAGAKQAELESFVGEKINNELWHIKVNTEYNVKYSGLQNTLFEICPNYSPAAEIVIEGSLEFKNPYGYLPGRFYGYLPFEGVRFCFYLLFLSYYMYAFFKYNDGVLKLHYAILSVLVIVTIEAFAWFMAFVNMNDTGTPYCCPFPAAVIVAMVSEVFQKTFSRALLLLVCMGYGITRPSLGKLEWICGGALTITFLGATTMDKVSTIVASSSLSGGAQGNLFMYTLPALLCDIVFLSWIYMALMANMKTLKAQKETYKLAMYDQLSRTIVAFVITFGILTAIILLSRLGAFVWPWKFLWVETVSWEVLNFAVLVALSCIWRPSTSSTYLAHSKQLPTNDDEEGGIEFQGSQFSITDDDEEVDMDEPL